MPRQRTAGRSTRRGGVEASGWPAPRGRRSRIVFAAPERARRSCDVVALHEPPTGRNGADVAVRLVEDLVDLGATRVEELLLGHPLDLADEDVRGRVRTDLHGEVVPLGRAEG